MTPDQMHLVTKENLARLHPLSKREFMGYVRNRLTPILGHAEMMVEAWRHDIDGEAAMAIAKSARQFLAELETLFAERQPESIGAQEKA